MEYVMIIGISPSPTLAQPFKTGLHTNYNNLNTRCSTQAIHPVDTFNLQRKTLLKTLETPALFEAVLDETKKPTLQIKTLRQILAKQKINSQELFTSPALLANFYEHLALQAENNLKKAGKSKKSEDLKFQAVMMRSLTDDVRNPHRSQVVNSSPNQLEQIQPQKNQVKFGAFTSLFAKTMMLFTDKGNWRAQSRDERKAASEKIINIGSLAAGATAGVLTKIMFADDAALTAVTAGTITRMAYGVYGVDNVSPAALGVIMGKVCGARIADGFMSYAMEKGLSVVPFLGEIATATTAFSLHQATGRIFMHYFESQIDRGEEPGLPMTARALLAVVGLGQATHAIDFSDEQTEHYNTLNDMRIAHGDYHAAPYSIAEAASGSGAAQEIHNMWDNTGHLVGIPGKEDFLNNILVAASSADDVVSIGRTLTKTPYSLTKKIIEEVRKDKKISSESMVQLLNYGGDLTTGALLILGGPNHIKNPGYLENMSLEKLVDEHFNKANGFHLDPAIVTAWATQAGISMSNSLKSKIINKADIDEGVKHANKVAQLRKDVVMDVANNRRRPSLSNIYYYDDKKESWVHSTMTSAQAEDLRKAQYFKAQNDAIVSGRAKYINDHPAYYEYDDGSSELKEPLENQKKSNAYFKEAVAKAMRTFGA
jgi:uncharacterized protein (DUF697 family)